MTCREKMKIEHPEEVNSGWLGGVAGCPDDVGYLPKPEGCNGDKINWVRCEKCWNRPLLDDVPCIKDSGTRREFETGAVRDIQEGKGRCDLMPLDVVALINGCGEESHIIRCISDFQKDGKIVHLCGAIEIFTFLYFNNSFPTMFLETSKHYEEGAKKYGEHNWQKGIPVKCCIDSAMRHYLKHLRGDKDEPHDRAFCWNIMCAIWTCMNKPELNDYAN